MEKGNVLVLGNSGVGKSTLINAVLGEKAAITGWGTEGTTKELSIHENQDVPFRLIDSVGFVPSVIKEQKAIQAVRRWSKECAKKGKEDSQINLIWFCVEGTSSKLFPEQIKNLSRATSMWKTVPVIVVITKSYSVPEREINKEMVGLAFGSQKHYSGRLRKVIPVVASTYVLNESAYAPPYGIADLISTTNELMPEGIKASKDDISQFILDRKRVLSQGVVCLAATTGVVVGAVPITIPDAVILTPLEACEINAIATIYGIGKNDESKNFLNSIIDAGTVGLAAKAAISALKTIPGINLAASLINAVIAGCMVVALGETSIYAFEQIYLGNKSLSDIDWVKKLVDAKFSSQFVDNVKLVLSKIADSTSNQDIAKIISEVFGTGTIETIDT